MLVHMPLVIRLERNLGLAMCTLPDLCPCRAREGFWVDVEAGKPPPAEADNFPGQYGTFSGRSSQSSGNGTYLFWVMAVGGGIMLLLIVHVLYLHFHRVESAGDAR
jgi:hypothetical protein